MSSFIESYLNTRHPHSPVAITASPSTLRAVVRKRLDYIGTLWIAADVPHAIYYGDLLRKYMTLYWKYTSMMRAAKKKG